MFLLEAQLGRGSRHSKRKSGPSPHAAPDNAPSAGYVRLTKEVINRYSRSESRTVYPLGFRRRRKSLPPPPRKTDVYCVKNVMLPGKKRKTRYLKRAYSNNNNAPKLVLFYNSIKKNLANTKPTYVAIRRKNILSSNGHSRVGLSVVAKGRQKVRLGKKVKENPSSSQPLSTFSPLLPLLKMFPRDVSKPAGR